MTIEWIALGFSVIAILISFYNFLHSLPESNVKIHIIDCDHDWTLFDVIFINASSQTTNILSAGLFVDNVRVKEINPTAFEGAYLYRHGNDSLLLKLKPLKVPSIIQSHGTLECFMMFHEIPKGKKYRIEFRSHNKTHKFKIDISDREPQWK